jgi:hypothetical protein
MVSIEVSKTYETVTPNSCERGEPEYTGYCFRPMLLRLRDALHEVKLLGSFDLSVFAEHVDLYGTDEEYDGHGETTTYHLRIKAKPRNIARIVKLIKGE